VLGGYFAQQAPKIKCHTNLIKQIFLMKTVSFILIPLIIFGIAIYVYLHKEQDKLAYKDKYDEAGNKVYRKKPIWGIRFVTNLGKLNSTEISMGLGLLSSITFIFLLTTNFSPMDSHASNFATIISAAISCIGSFAAIIGFFIGAFGAFQTKNESSAMKYGGILFSVVGIFNIGFVFEFFLPIAMLIAWIFG
jgi:hypothetical protein